MTSADIRWLLAQPEALRRALVEVPGPGYHISADLDASLGPDPIVRSALWKHSRAYDRLVYMWAWAPCDPCAIAVYAAGLMNCPSCSLERNDSRVWTASAWRYATDDHHGRGPTAFRAAVALLAASLGIELVEASE